MAALNGMILRLGGPRCQHDFPLDGALIDQKAGVGRRSVDADLAGQPIACRGGPFAPDLEAFGDFGALDEDIRRGVDADFDAGSLDAGYADGDSAADDDFLADLAGQNEHFLAFLVSCHDG